MDDIRSESKKYGGGGDNTYFRFDEAGVYRIRILNAPKVTATHFFGKGKGMSAVCMGMDEGCPYHTKDDQKASIKLATYVIDRADGKVKMGELPLSISYSLNDLQEDEDFAFTEFPMPYDVKITYDPDNNDPKAKYRLVASPKHEPLTDEEVEALEVAMESQTPEQYVEHKKSKQKEKTGEVRTNEVKTTEVSPRKSPGIDYPKNDVAEEDMPF